MVKAGGEANPVVIESWRGDEIEARHRGAYCVVRAGAVIDRGGDVARGRFMRSAAKFFQALPTVMAGVESRFGLGDDALALMCASHGGEPGHVAVAESMLSAAGLEEGHLLCGAHAPLHAPAAQELTRSGRKPTRLHNNCSGKHAGMLLGSLCRGEAIEDYLNPDHPLQTAIREVLARMAGVAPQDVKVMVDGCSAPTFWLALEAAATAFWRFSAATRLETDLSPAARRLWDAVARRPLMIAGNDRLCSAVAEATRGRVLCKIGADGFYGAMCRDPDVGLALHIDDGNWGASERLLVALLAKHRLMSAEESATLAKWTNPVRKNWAGMTVGRVVVLV